MAARVQSPQGPETHLPAARQPLMGSENSNAEDARRQEGQGNAFLWYLTLALLLLLFNSAVSTYVARADPWEVIFGTAVSMGMFFLFGALIAYDRTPPEDASRRRRHLRAAIWGLATALNFGFSLRAAAAVPTVVSLAIWGWVVFFGIVGLRLLVFEGRDDAEARVPEE